MYMSGLPLCPYKSGPTPAVNVFAIVCSLVSLHRKYILCLRDFRFAWCWLRNQNGTLQNSLQGTAKAEAGLKTRA